MDHRQSAHAYGPWYQVRHRRHSAPTGRQSTAGLQSACSSAHHHPLHSVHRLHSWRVATTSRLQGMRTLRHVSLMPHYIHPRFVWCHSLNPHAASSHRRCSDRQFAHRPRRSRQHSVLQCTRWNPSSAVLSPRKTCAAVLPSAGRVIAVRSVESADRLLTVLPFADRPSRPVSLDRRIVNHKYAVGQLIPPARIPGNTAPVTPPLLAVQVLSSTRPR